MLGLCVCPSVSMSAPVYLLVCVCACVRERILAGPSCPLIVPAELCRDCSVFSALTHGELGQICFPTRSWYDTLGP